MANFNEHSLEMSIMDLFQDEGSTLIRICTVLIEFYS